MNRKGYRAIIRQFLKGVEWAGPRSVSILIHGHGGKYNWADTELAEMAATKRQQPLKRLISHHHIYATPETRKKDKGEFRMDHDMKLRDVLAKFLHARGHAGIGHLSVKRAPGNPDAHISTVASWHKTGGGSSNSNSVEPSSIVYSRDTINHSPITVYFELDTGHENDAQLIAKLRRYSGPGAFQVVFVMAHRYGHKELEAERLEKLQALGQKVLGHKPNRILGATYHGFLDNGVLVNLKGERR